MSVTRSLLCLVVNIFSFQFAHFSRWDSSAPHPLCSLPWLQSCWLSRSKFDAKFLRQLIFLAPDSSICHPFCLQAPSLGKLRDHMPVFSGGSVLERGRCFKFLVINVRGPMHRCNQDTRYYPSVDSPNCSGK